MRAILALVIGGLPLLILGETIRGEPPQEPDDPEFSLQWGLYNIGQVVNGKSGVNGADVSALAAWSIYAGGEVTVAIVGAGVDAHPEFADRLLPGFVTDEAGGDPFSTLSTCSQATHLAGIIGAARDNGVGVAGLNDRAKLLPIRVVNGCSPTRSSTAEGITWAANHGTDIVLVPLAFAEGDPALEAAVNHAVAMDALVIAPAGHDATNDVYFPAAYDGCIAVSATSLDDTLMVESNSGPQVEISAPGDTIRSTSSTAAGYAYRTGTDVAAAFVAGVAALIRAYAPQLSATEVRQVLADSAEDLGTAGRDPQFGEGRLNAEAALQLVEPPPLRLLLEDPPPDTVLPGQPFTFDVIAVETTEMPKPGSPVLFYRGDQDSAFSVRPMTSLGDGRYTAELPPAPCNATIEYYVKAISAETLTPVTNPPHAPQDLYATAANRDAAVFWDDMETDMGWTSVVEGEGETHGAWTRVVPLADPEPSPPAYPTYDFTPDAGAYCYTTGAHLGGSPGQTDVDGGPVRLVSPVVTVDAPDAQVSYARWLYSQFGETDELIVELSHDAGGTWPVEVERVSPSGAWQQHAFRLSDFPAIAGNDLRLRFSTSDVNPADSLTVAALDEFRVTAIGCVAAPGDYNGDGAVDRQDLARLTECLSGPRVPIGTSWCDLFDSDSDGDVDLVDSVAFHMRFQSTAIAP